MASLPTIDEYLQTHLLTAVPLCVDEKCPICDEEWNLAEDEIVRLKECDHVFHRECVTFWFNTDRDNCNTCPLCRRVLFERLHVNVVHITLDVMLTRPSRELLETVHREDPQVLDTIDFASVVNSAIALDDLVLPLPRGPPTIELVDASFRIAIGELASVILSTGPEQILWKLEVICCLAMPCWTAVWGPQVLREGAFRNYLMTVLLRDYADRMPMAEWAFLSSFRRNDFLRHAGSFSPTDISILTSVPQMIFTHVVSNPPEQFETVRTYYNSMGSVHRASQRITARQTGAHTRFPLAQDTTVYIETDPSTHQLTIQVKEIGFGSLVHATVDDHSVSLINTDNIRFQIDFSQNQ